MPVERLALGAGRGLGLSLRLFLLLRRHLFFHGRCGLTARRREHARAERGCAKHEAATSNALPYYGIFAHDDFLPYGMRNAMLSYL